MALINELPDLRKELGEDKLGDIVLVSDPSAVDLLHPRVLRYLRTSDEEPKLVKNERTSPGSEEFEEDIERAFARGEPKRPYWYRRYQYGRGFLNIKRDAICLKITAYATYAEGEGPERVCLISLRDRMYDGHARVDEYPLSGWSYSTPGLDDAHTSSLEIVVQFRDPEHIFPVDQEHRKFLRNPYRFLTKDWEFWRQRPRELEEEFVRHWLRAFRENRGNPGRDAWTIQHAFEHFKQRMALLTTDPKYTTVSAVPSYLHIVRALRRPPYNFAFRSTKQRQIVEAIEEAIGSIIFDLEEYGIELSRRQGSWIGVLQYVEHEDLIPKKLRIDLNVRLRRFPKFWMMISRSVDWGKTTP